LYCTDTPHSGAPHRRKYDLARQRNSQRPSTLKINRTRQEVIKEKHHKAPPTYTTEKNKIPPEEINSQRKEKRHNNAKI
jgi:hypothetical protein